MRGRIERLSARLPWLVAQRGDEVIGYAYASPHRDRAGYRWSADVSAYVDASARRTGVAFALYDVLLKLLETQDLRSAFADIALPNEASIALHRSAGFELVGVYQNVGYKLGAWRDTAWWQRPIGTASSEPQELIAFDRLSSKAIEPLLTLVTSR